MELMQVIWDVNPAIINIKGFEIRWYGLFFAMSFILGYWIFAKFQEKENVDKKFLDSLLLYMGIGTIVGARLGHCLFYEPEKYLSNPIEILYIRQGGLASHGAAIGIIIALLILSRVKKKPFLWIIDRIVITVALSGFFIRMGNLMNSEIFGYPTELPWGFVFVRAYPPQFEPRHPTQIYEALSYLLIFFGLLWFYYKKNGKPKPGILLGMFLTFVFSMRFLIEFLKEVQVSFEQTWILNLGQWLSIPFVLAGIVIWIIASRRTIKNPDVDPPHPD